jgi:hypothetical protein
MSGRVIVGVDGSETARKAVRWAARGEAAGDEAGTRLSLGDPDLQLCV